MRYRRLAAGIGAAVLVLGTTATITAPVAQAFGPTAVTLAGSLFLGNSPGATIATTNNMLNETITLTTTPSGTLNAGVTVTVNLSGANGPSTGPVGLSANGQVVRGVVELTGAMTGDVGLNQGNTAPCTYPATAIGTNSPQGPWATSGTFTSTGNGIAQVRLKQIFFDDQGNKDGSIASQCAGSANNADYYLSDVVQVPGSNQPGLAKTAPQASSTIFEAPFISGPSVDVMSVTGQRAGVTGYARSGDVLNVSGGLWAPSVSAGGYTARLCNPSGALCDAPAPNTLSSDVSGNLSGTIAVPPAATTGSRTIVVSQGANQNFGTPLVVLGTRSVTLTPAFGGAGTVVAVSGSNWDPLAEVQVRGFVAAFPPFAPSADGPVTINASSTGVITTNYTVNDVATVFIGAGETPPLGNYSFENAFAPFSVNQDRCVAYSSDAAGGPGCTTAQNVNVSVLQGRLVQRAYVNSTPSVGSTNSAAVSPIQGTANVNPDALTVNLGTITSPLAPATIVGNLNDITVTDNRGGSFGWSLSATMPDFAGTPNNNTIANSQLTADPSCAPATNATAWDYKATGKTAIVGFDDALNAPGVTAGAAAQNFGGTVLLCVKGIQTNPTTQSSGGVYNVTSTLTLTVPAFQAADRYTSTITTLLA